MINWDDFNYDDINWDDLKKYFEGSNTGESYFDPNSWYTTNSNDINYQEWLKGELLKDEMDDEELRYYENNNLYESLCGLNDMPSNKAKIILEKDNIFHSGKDKIIKELISYFEDLEEYEKCANLLKVL